MNDFPSIDLGVLTARQREVIEMRYSCCLSWRTIAAFLSIDESTVREHHKAALTQLRRHGIPPHFHIKVDA